MDTFFFLHKSKNKFTLYLKNTHKLLKVTFTPFTFIKKSLKKLLQYRKLLRYDIWREYILIINYGVYLKISYSVNIFSLFVVYFIYLVML